MRLCGVFAAGAICGALLTGWVRPPAAGAADADAIPAVPPAALQRFQLVPVGNQYFMVVDGQSGQVWRGHTSGNLMERYSLPK
jgi:hypothetical protein